jgi:pyruvate formate lyase activating enzyme
MNIGLDVPIHFTQFHPDYLLNNLTITPISTLERARQIAMAEGLHYVYLGNVPGHPGENTYCPACGGVVVERRGMGMQKMLISKGACSFCDHPIPGIWHA